MVGDIRNYEVCLKACEGIQVVVHLAASTGVPQSIENPRRDMEMNVIGTFNMLEASRHLSPYGASRLAGEAYCSAYYRTFGLKTVVLHFGNVYGPRSKHKSSVIAKFFQTCTCWRTFRDIW